MVLVKKSYERIYELILNLSKKKKKKKEKKNIVFNFWKSS